MAQTKRADAIARAKVLDGAGWEACRKQEAGSLEH